MKKFHIGRIAFLLSLLFNLGAVCIYYQWVANTIVVNERISEVQGQFELFRNSSNMDFRVCYADRACTLAAKDDGTYFFYTSNFGDMISLGLMLENQIDDNGLKERRYMLAGRNFVTSWKYKGDGRCCDVVYQYNDGPQMRDVMGNGVFRRCQHNEKLNFSERAYREASDDKRLQN